MKLTPYKKLLTMAKEAVDATLAPVRAHAAKKLAELEMAKLDERIATLESELITACSQKDVNFNKIIDKLDEIGLAERRKKQFENIVAEMFPEYFMTTENKRARIMSRVDREKNELRKFDDMMKEIQERADFDHSEAEKRREMADELEAQSWFPRERDDEEYIDEQEFQGERNRLVNMADRLAKRDDDDCDDHDVDEE